MADDRDELDASDWLASQFGEEPEPAPAAPPVAPAAPPVAPPPLAPAPPVQPPPAFQPPPLQAPVTPPPVVQPPAYQAPPVYQAPPAYQPPVEPPVYQAPPAYSPPPFNPPPLAVPEQAVPPQPAQPQPPVAPPADAPFQWGLTPGAPVTPQPEAAAPVSPTPPQFELPAYTPPPAYEPPTVAYIPPPLEPPAPPTTAMPPVASALPDATQWFAAPVDPSLEGVTEVFEAELVGAAAPVDEGPATSAIDSLFGENQFRDFSGEPLIPAPPPRGPAGPATATPKAERAPIPRTQKILMWVAGSLVALLALLALFLLGTRLSAVLGPAPAVSPTPSATPSPSAGAALPLGPVIPGEYQWDELLGGECITPFVSAWEDRYTVVACTTPHKAQMIYRGTFPDALTVAYPGLEELQKRINLLCTAPTVIDYAAAGTAQDIQVSASFAVDEQDWNDGNRTYYCFVNRSGGEDLTVSIAVPQVAPAPAPLPTP